MSEYQRYKLFHLLIGFFLISILLTARSSAIEAPSVCFVIQRGDEIEVNGFSQDNESSWKHLTSVWHQVTGSILCTQKSNCVHHSEGTQSRLRLRIIYEEVAQGHPGKLGVFSVVVEPFALTIRAEDFRNFITALYSILETHAHARFFMPGELGIDYPYAESIRIKTGTYTTIPDFDSRTLVGVDDLEPWATMNYLTPYGHHKFHHAIGNYLNTETYQQSPFFFSNIHGQRNPSKFGTLANQPNFANEAMAHHFAQIACQFFRDNPQALSFSLGMNDTHDFDESKETQQLIAPIRYFRGLLDYSDLVFTFMNRVATATVKEFPNQYLGALAYHNTENVPRFKIHPNVMPYLTADRSQWIHEDFKNEDQKLIRQWVNSGASIVGLYDYYYGSAGFVIPRIHLNTIIESITFAQKNGVRGFYAELFPFWALDGPKPWLTAQLLKNTNQDAQKLLNDYYTHYFKEAALPMKDFFETCEHIWQSQSPPAKWLKFYRNDNQLELFSPEKCVLLNSYLDIAKKLAGDNAKIFERIHFVQQGFALTTQASEYYSIKKQLAMLDVKSSNAAILLTLVNYFLNKEAQLKAYYTELKNSHELNKNIQDIDYLFANDPLAGVFIRVIHSDWSASEKNIFLKSFVSSAPRSWVPHLVSKGFSHLSINKSVNLLKNHDFKSWDSAENKPSFWHTYAFKSENTFFAKVKSKTNTETDSLKHSQQNVQINDGDKQEECLIIQGSEQFDLSQIVCVNENKFYCLKAQVSGKMNIDGLFYIQIRWFDRDLKFIQSSKSVALPHSISHTKYDLNLMDVSPSKAFYALIELRTNKQDKNNAVSIHSVTFTE